jgi:hypothetical protein
MKANNNKNFLYVAIMMMQNARINAHPFPKEAIPRSVHGPVRRVM